MTKKDKPKKLRLKGVHLPKEPKRRTKKFLKIPGKLHREEGKKHPKALLKIPVKPVPEKKEQPSIPASPKLTDLSFEAIKPDEIEKMLEAMAPQEPKKVEEKIRQGKWQPALLYLKKWLLRVEWDWKSITSVTALLIIGLLALLVIYKVYHSTSTWQQDAQNITIPESQLFHPTTSDAEKNIDRLREKVDQTYQKETGKNPPTYTSSNPTPPKQTSSYSTQTITKPSPYTRTGSSSTNGEINEYVLRKFLHDAGDLYSSLPKDSKVQIGFTDSTGEAIQGMFYSIEGGFLTTGRNRAADFLLYFPQGYASQIAMTNDPCGLAEQLYNGNAYKLTPLRSEAYLRQKYGALIRTLRDCRNKN